MLKFQNHLGTICVSKQYLENLIGSSVTSSFGVAGMAMADTTQTLRSKLFKKDSLSNGIQIKTVRGKLSVNIHIIVTYGMNISEIVKSITHKVRFVIEQATGTSVGYVNVFVDSMKA